MGFKRLMYIPDSTVSSADYVIQNGMCYGKAVSGGTTPTSWNYAYILGLENTNMYVIKVGTTPGVCGIGCFAIDYTPSSKRVTSWSGNKTRDYTDSLSSSLVIDGVTVRYSIGTGRYNMTNSDVDEFIGTPTQAATAFYEWYTGGMTRQWNIKYIPINCSLTGETLVNPYTNVDVTITPYPQAEFLGATVYYSGGIIENTITGNTLSFTTPNISNE